MNVDNELKGLELNPNDNQYHAKVYGKKPGSNRLDSSWFMGDKYSYLTIDEKLSLTLGNMMYGDSISDLSYDDDKVHSVLCECEGKSWKFLCREVLDFYGIDNHDVDIKSNLISAFKKFMNEFLGVSNSYGNPQHVVESRFEAAHLLRLWHLLRYDKNDIYFILDEFQLLTAVPIYNYMKSQLAKSNDWEKSYVFDIMYWANRLILDYYIKNNLLNKDKSCIK